MSSDATRLSDLVARPDTRELLLRHARRGLRVRAVIRLALAAVVVGVLAWDPPARHAAACWAVAGVFAAFAVATAVVSRRRRVEVPLLGSAWLALFVDVAVLAVLAVLASASDRESWTSDVLLNAFFLVPLLASTQLRPFIGVLVGLPTTVVYLVASAVARPDNGEPWSSVLLRSAVLAALFVGSVLLIRVQRSRVGAIGGLAVERSGLLAEVVAVEERERRVLAENLHDGVLQYLLAARQDLADARATGDETSFDRVAEALQRSTVLLRGTMTELHPAVLQQSGLPSALRELVASTAARSGLRIELDTTGWAAPGPTPVDALLFGVARELLGNVVKHADAAGATVVLRADGVRAELEVRDDGVGLAPGALEARLAEGHIGVASRRARVAAAGGTLRFAPVVPHGTAATVSVPLPG